MKKTNTSEEVLELLFGFPTRRFSIREISRMLKISPSAVSKAVRQLEKENLISVNRKFVFEIQANLSNLNFKNMKRVYNLKSIYISGLFGYLSESFPLSTIILFGSYSRGEDIEKSDIDIAIINSKEKIINLERFEKLLGRKISLHFYSNLKNIETNLKTNIFMGITLKGGIEL